MKSKLLSAAVPFLLAVLLLAGCKAKKEVVRVKLPNRSAEELIELMEKNEANNGWFSLKSSADVNFDGKSNSFKASIRIRKDSAIWMSISPLFGIEMARVLITEDSVKMMNRVKSTYFMGDYAYLNDLFDSNVDFNIIQSLLLGNSIAIENVDKPVASEDKKTGQYLLSSIKRRKLRKAMEKDKDKYGSVAYSHWLNPKTFKVERLTVYDLDANRSLNAVFSDFKETEPGLFPGKVELEMQGEQTVTMKADYTKITLDKPVKLSFKIPEKYERITFVNPQSEQ